MQQSTAVMAAVAITPFAPRVGCTDDGMHMGEFEHQALQQQEM